ncbi:hypothetical protein ACO0LD_05255 [Undibacterium sp. Ji83W]|uniref:hypothetical protein n=1 Tax=Undibacterium sp. Ji83W TaxID=3413043 RepID=UPI003BF0B7EE
MSVIIRTNYPKRILSAFDKDVTSQRVDTWIKNSNGSFSPKDHQHMEFAGFYPTVNAYDLTFQFKHTQPKGIGIIAGASEDENPDFTYAYYHGHLTSTLLYHYSKDIEGVLSTALKR